MPVFKNEDNGTWYVMARYVNWKGERKQKCKRGFATKKEAQEWERMFQLQNASDLDMSFEAFTELYIRDVKTRLKENTWLTKEHIIRTKILPYFGKLRISEISTKEIITWQNELLAYRDEKKKHICNKTAYNSLSKNNDVELYYFTNGNRRLEMKRNPDYSTIENDLLVESMLQNSNKVKVYSEDAENRWFIQKLVPEYLPYVDILDVKIGCDQLLSLYTGDISYFGNVLIVLDGDVKDKDLETIPEQLKTRLNNIIKLPGTVRPEEVIYKYIINLDPEHPYWEKDAAFSHNNTSVYYGETLHLVKKTWGKNI